MSQHQMVPKDENIADEPEMCRESAKEKSSSDAGDDSSEICLYPNIPSPSIGQSSNIFETNIKNLCDLKNSKTVAEAILSFLKLGIYPKNKQSDEDLFHRVIPTRMRKCASCRKRKRLLDRHYMPLRNIKERDATIAGRHLFLLSSERLSFSQNSQLSNEPMSPVVERYAKIITSQTESEVPLPSADRDLEELNNVPQKRILVKSPTKEYSFPMNVPSKSHDSLSPYSPPCSDANKDLNPQVDITRIKKNIFSDYKCYLCNEYIEKRPLSKKSPIKSKSSLPMKKGERILVVLLERLTNSNLKKWTMKDSTTRECSVIIKRLSDNVFLKYHEKYSKRNARMTTRSRTF